MTIPMEEKYGRWARAHLKKIIHEPICVRIWGNELKSVINAS
jgi:hypothetical protein